MLVAVYGCSNIHCQIFEVSNRIMPQRQEHPVPEPCTLHLHLLFLIILTGTK